MNLTLKQIDAAVYNLIRLQAIAFKCLADARNYDTYQGYNTAKLNLQAAGNTIVEVYPVGAKQERDSLQQATITIDRQDEQQSDLAGAYELQAQAENGLVNITQVPNSATDINYTATFYSQSNRAAYMAETIISEAWKQNTVVRGLNEDYSEAETFIFVKGPTIDLSSPDYLEKQFNITVKYAYTNPSNVFQIPAMLELNFIPKINS